MTQPADQDGPREKRRRTSRDVRSLQISFGFGGSIVLIMVCALASRMGRVGLFVTIGLVAALSAIAAALARSPHRRGWSIGILWGSAMAGLLAGLCHGLMMDDES